MSRRAFLFVMVESGGGVPPQLGVARGLRERGHRVRVLSDPAVDAEARAAGLEFSSFHLAPHHNMRDRHRDILRDWEAGSPKEQLQRLGRTLLFEPAERYARDVIDELERFPADAVAVDWMVLGAQIGAEASGLPTALLWHNPYSAPAKGRPPSGLGLRPVRGPIGRIRDGILRRLIARAFDAQGLEAINAARTAIGLAPLGSVFDQLERADVALVLTSPAFDQPTNGLPARVRHVGPELDDPSWTSPWTSPWPAEHPRPLVLVSLGSTYQNQGDLTRRIVNALGPAPVRALVTLGGVFSPHELPAADDVVVVRSAPHAAVLPLASAVVTHGGHGTVMKALAAGLPVVCLPLGRDQKDNAARLEATGAGIRLDPSASPEKIRRAVHRVLERQRYREAARRLAATIREEVEERAVLREMEELAAGGAPSSLSTQLSSGVNTTVRSSTK